MEAFGSRNPGCATTRAVEAVLAATAILMPLIVLPGVISDAVETPKLAVLAISTAALIGIGLGRALFLRQPMAPAGALSWPLFFLLIASAVSLLAARPGNGHLGFLYTASLVTCAIMASSLFDYERPLNALFIASAVVAAYGMGQYLGIEVFSWASHFKPRIFATMGNPVFLGGFLAAIFPLAFARWLFIEKEETKDLYTLLLGLLGFAIYLTWTRSAWLAILIATGAQGILLARHVHGRALLRRNREWLVTILLIAVVGVGLASSTRIMGKSQVPLLDRVRDAADPTSYSVRFRMVTAESALRIARENPILGAGPGSFPAVYPHVRLKTIAARRTPGQYFASQEAYAHNDHLQTLAETGVLGLGAWLWLLAASLRLALLRYRNGSWLGLGGLGVIAAVCTDASLNFPMRIAPTAWIFFLVLGLMGIEGKRKTLPPQAGFWRVAATGLLSAALALSLVKPIWHILRAQHFKMLGDRQISYNNYEMAAAHYTRALKHAPANKFINFCASVAVMQAARFEWYGAGLDRAMSMAKKALALGYEDENVYKHMGDIYGRKDSMPQAIRVLTVAHALNPEREDIANNLAYYLAESGTRLSEAVRLAELAARKAPGHPSFMDTLGWAYYRAGKLAQAERMLEKALAALTAPEQAAAKAEVERHLAEVRRARRQTR